jgi:hypothetical protein
MSAFKELYTTKYKKFSEEHAMAAKNTNLGS